MLQHFLLKSMRKTSFFVIAVFLLFPQSGFSQSVHVSRCPYLSCVTESTVVISWETDVATSSVVYYGLTDQYGEVYNDTTQVQVHIATLTGLEGNCTYHYKILYGDASTPDFTFMTAVPYDTSFTFVVYGDTRTNHSAHQEVLRRMLEYRPRFALHTGDLVNNGQLFSDWEAYFVDICDSTNFAAQVPIFYAIGNHERNADYYYDFFVLPRNNPDSTEAYYSFDFGNSHFICLNTEIDFVPELAQHRWLEADLRKARNKAKFIFVFFHRPPYSSGSHGSDLNIQRAFCPLLEKYGVNTVFTGHDHLYERTVPIKGVTYVVSGGGGAPLYEISPHSWTAYGESVCHFCLLHVVANSFTLQMIRNDGTMGDRYHSVLGRQSR